MREGLSSATVIVEIGDGGDNISDGMRNDRLILLLRWNGDDIGEKEKDQNGLNMQESEYV